jgi:hypothetical protein
MTTERMLVYRDWHEWLDRLPDDVLHFGVESTHDGGDLHSVVGRCDGTPIFSGPPQRPVDGLFTRELPVQRPISLFARPLRSGNFGTPEVHLEPVTTVAGDEVGQRIMSFA